MSQSRSEFLIKTMLLCIILFSLVTIAHTLALIVKGDVEAFNTDDINETIGDKERDDNSTETSWDLTSPAGTIGSLLVGLDMPMPFPIIITIFNVVVLTILVYCALEYIHSWVPFMPGG